MACTIYRHCFSSLPESLFFIQRTTALTATLVELGTRLWLATTSKAAILQTRHSSSSLICAVRVQTALNDSTAPIQVQDCVSGSEQVMLDLTKGADILTHPLGGHVTFLISYRFNYSRVHQLHCVTPPFTHSIESLLSPESFSHYLPTRSLTLFHKAISSHSHRPRTIHSRTHASSPSITSHLLDPFLMTSSFFH